MAFGLFGLLGVGAGGGCGGPEGAEAIADEEKVEHVQQGVQVASSTLAGYPVWAHFTNPPVQTNGRDYTIHRELQRLMQRLLRLGLGARLLPGGRGGHLRLSRGTGTDRHHRDAPE